MITTRLLLVPVFAFGLSLAGCNGSHDSAPDGGTADSGEAAHAGDSGGEHAGEDQAHDAAGGHGHEEVSLGTATVGDMTVECWQGHGTLKAGAEMHLVVKLPYEDKGATEVRAWIGTDERLESMVGRGAYAASHDDYDIHAEAPDPLPANPMWWIEVTKPDGTKAVGSVKPLE